MKKKTANNYAFIDSQNLNLGVRSQGWKLDFGKFRQYLITKYQKRYSSLLKKFNQYIMVVAPLKQKLRVNKKRGIPSGNKVRLR